MTYQQFAAILLHLKILIVLLGFVVGILIALPTRRGNDGPGLATTHRIRARHDRNDSYQKLDGLPVAA